MTALRRESGLEAHRGSLITCRRCGLPAGVAPIVSLAVSPKVMLVGQAPGRVESTGGRPFAGRAGKQLFRWFARAGIDEDSARRRIYIAAITRCYPGPSPSGRGDRVPSPVEQDACASWLDAELRMIAPRVIIPVGRLAINRFLEPISLDRLIGSAHRAEHAGGASIVIPLPHPSGASSWIHEGDHPALLERAIGLIAELVTPLVVKHSRTSTRRIA